MHSTELIEQDKVIDLLGIGIGPFNLGLAALSAPISQIKSLFIEQKPRFNWHPGLLLADTTLQIPFLADLVTFADPTSPYSFLNYLNAHNRLYKFYFYENFFILREEYNHYCQWVVSQLSNLRFSCKAVDINLEQAADNNQYYKVTLYNNHSHKTETVYTKHIALGVGTTPHIPAHLVSCGNPCIFHSASFLEHEAQLKQLDSICVVGSGQSAAEVILELLNQQQEFPRKLTWITRASGFFPMEYSKLGLEHFSPDYMQQFYALESKVRTDVLKKQNLLYKGISKQTIADIFDRLYQLTVGGKPSPLLMLSHINLEAIETAPNLKSKLILKSRNTLSNVAFDFSSESVILATGYQAHDMKFLNSLSHVQVTNNNQPYQLNADFSIKNDSLEQNKIFVQNNSLFSHGVGSPDLGMGCYRNMNILNSILEHDYYTLEAQTIFQNFNFSGASN